MVKKFFCVFISIFILFSLLSMPTLAYKPSTFSITGEGCILASADTGAIIYDKNADTRFYPASLTKIMTAVVVLDECKDPKNVMVTAEKNELDVLLGTDSSVLGLVEGEQFSALELLYILLRVCYSEDLKAQKARGLFFLRRLLEQRGKKHQG